MVPSFLKDSWLGAFFGHCILIPLWTLAPVPLLASVSLICLGGTHAIIGLCIVVLLAIIRMVPLPYSPSMVQMFYDLDCPNFYGQCKLCGPHLSRIRHEKTLFMFHPHGILSVGFTMNGCWNKHFNALAAAKDVDTPKSTGTIFLIDKVLREWPHLFK